MPVTPRPVKLMKQPDVSGYATDVAAKPPPLRAQIKALTTERDSLLNALSQAQGRNQKLAADLAATQMELRRIVETVCGERITAVLDSYGCKLSQDAASGWQVTQL